MEDAASMTVIEWGIRSKLYTDHRDPSVVRKAEESERGFRWSASHLGFWKDISNRWRVVRGHRRESFG
jgi:hypothetical protein